MDTFAIFLHADELPEPFEPTEDDLIEECDECGGDLHPNGLCPNCDDDQDDEPSDDFPMYLEYNDWQDFGSEY